MSKDRQRTRRPTLSEVIETRLGNRLEGLHTTMPGKIDKWNPALQKADVKPLLKRPLADEDGNDIDAEVLPVIPEVPVRFPRADFSGSKFFMSWPLKKGDLVTLHFTERSLDQWLAKPAGEDVDPLQFRTHDLSDCFAVPGLYPFEEPLADADPDNLVMGKDGGGMQLHFLPDDTVEFRVGGEADVSVAIAETLQAFWDTQAKVHLDNLFAALTAWVPVPTDGGAALKAALATYLASPPPVFDAAVISDKLKLKDNG